MFAFMQDSIIETSMEHHINPFIGFFEAICQDSVMNYKKF